MRLVSGEGQHYKIGIKTVKAMNEVGIPVWLAFVVSNVLHDLVLSFTGNLEESSASWRRVEYLMTRENDFDVAPQTILTNLLLNEELQVL